MDGKYWAWLAGFETARTFAQTVTGLNSGDTYAIKFIMASEFVNSDSLNLSVNGGAATLFTAPPYPGGTSFWDTWVDKQLNFTATGTSAAILFDSTGLNLAGYDVGFDNVRIVDLSRSGGPVPEPMTLGLFGAGLAGIGALLRRRKQQKA